MKKIHCQLNIPSNSPHLYQIITGFLLLEQSGDISLTINYDPSLISTLPSPHVIEVIIDNEIVVAYDMLDGYNLESEELRKYLNNVDYYFKRSFSDELNQKYKIGSSIHALGFNYCFATNHPIFKAMSKGGFVAKVKDIARTILGKTYLIDYTAFEDSPRDNLMPTVLFSTRVWEPESNLEDKLNSEREYINNMRAKCIRLLRKELGNQFIGGMSPSHYSNQKFPDCILPANVTKKSNYMNLVKKSDICIATMGLHGSNGWKMGEYVAASKAIVAEHMQYSVPGDFLLGKNYEEFIDADECVQRTLELVSNRDGVYQMKMANYEYYKKFLRPDRLVYNSLLTVFNSEVNQ